MKKNILICAILTPLILNSNVPTCPAPKSAATKSNGVETAKTPSNGTATSKAYDKNVQELLEFILSKEFFTGIENELGQMINKNDIAKLMEGLRTTLREDLTKVFKNGLSPEETEAILKFFKSKEGQNFFKINADAQQTIMQSTQNYIIKYMSEQEAKLQKEAAQKKPADSSNKPQTAPSAKTV